jgi:hypothetical protein
LKGITVSEITKGLRQIWVEAGAMLFACRLAGLSALVRNPKLGQFFVGRSPANVGQSPSWRAMWRQFGECAIMNIKHVAAIAVLFIGASPPVLADDQKPANAQEGYVPPLNLKWSQHNSIISSCGTRAQCKTGRWQIMNWRKSEPVLIEQGSFIQTTCNQT